LGAGARAVEMVVVVERVVGLAEGYTATHHLIVGQIL
jgi:hypothetical protein